MLYRSTPYRRKEGAASRAPSSPSLGPYSPPNAARSQDNVGGARPPPARWSPGHPTRGRRPPARASLLPLVLASAAASFLILWLTGGFGGAPRPPHPPSAGAADDDVLDRYRSGSVQVHAGARGGLPVGTVEERASAALGVLEAHHGSGGLREGAGRHERAAAALLLADILVQAEHDVVADAAMAAGLGPDDGDYVAMAGGGTHAYLPYEVDALDCPYFAVAAWIRPDEGGGGGGSVRAAVAASPSRRPGNQVVWSTVPRGRCCVGSDVSSPRASEDFAGMEISIRSGRLTLTVIEENGTCRSQVTCCGAKDFVKEGEWAHVGASVSGREVRLFLNGRRIATFDNGSRAGYTYRGPVEAPEARPKGRMNQTMVGRRADGTGSLQGRVALMSIWTGEEAIDDESLLAAYETSKRGHASDAKASSGQEPTSFYKFDGQRTQGATRDAVSRLTDMISGRHGTIRRLLPDEPFVHHRGGARLYGEYASGSSKVKVTQKMQDESDNLARTRLIHIRNAIRHTWEGYRTEAWGYDELFPVSGGGKDSFGGMGTTLVDSLSTLWLCGLREEFYEARDWVQEELDFDSVEEVSVFETTIRSLGGLLSAYDLSGDPVFLQKADDLGSKLLKAFDSPSGLPYGQAVLNGREVYNTDWHSNHAILSELGTLQIEFRFLSRATGNLEYERKALKVIDVMEKMKDSDGLYYLYVKNQSKKPAYGNKRISFGAMGDSFYEYLLKLWLQSGRKDSKYRRMYDEAMDGMHKLLIQKHPASGLTYVGEMDNGTLENKMDHLSCFLAGNLVLGAFTSPGGLTSIKAQRDLRTGKALAYTCYQMYAQSPTGIAPEVVWFGPDGIERRRHAIYNFLRPETAETFYILYKLTGDPTYREWGHEMFLALNEHLKTDLAFGSMEDVENPELEISDKMESFFVAETLKYLYLLQDPNSEIDILRKHVFNTEAHPLRILDET